MSASRPSAPSPSCVPIPALRRSVLHLFRTAGALTRPPHCRLASSLHQRRPPTVHVDVRRRTILSRSEPVAASQAAPVARPRALACLPRPRLPSQLLCAASCCLPVDRAAHPQAQHHPGNKRRLDGKPAKPRPTDRDHSAIAWDEGGSLDEAMGKLLTMANFGVLPNQYDGPPDDQVLKPYYERYQIIEKKMEDLLRAPAHVVQQRFSPLVEAVLVLLRAACAASCRTAAMHCLTRRLAPTRPPVVWEGE